ncbi:ABC transporter ATP-binding protein [Candidatus Merdisoma sp. JLR.KK006]|uniref:ABC transporter ATP-binding protein n=1 Tax=Candidatus Merdisoma sp. JLR.KK006 TaxID=3112626 RepID=UPI002FF234CA
MWEQGKSIKLMDVNKSFGKTKVLHNISLECNQGEITGIIGRNGAGKTLLFKIMCGLMSVDSGDIVVNGIKRKKQSEVLRSAGIIIEDPAFLKNYSGIKNLEYLYMLNHKNDKSYLEEVMKRVGLDPKSKKHVGKYSMGMRQRLAIAQAIMENPNFLILDEPFNGLDNQGVVDMRNIFLEFKQEGKIIIVASHNSEDIKVLCDHVYNMEAGKLKIIR